MNYRSFYSKHFNITWDGEEMEVHHIDGNRNNNDIENLILLPKELHRELHDTMREIRMVNRTFSEIVEGMTKGVLNYGQDWNEMVMREHIIVLEKCRRWGFLKCVGYNDGTGCHIDTITLDTFKWID